MSTSSAVGRWSACDCAWPRTERIRRPTLLERQPHHRPVVTQAEVDSLSPAQLLRIFHLIRRVRLIIAPTFVVVGALWASMWTSWSGFWGVCGGLFAASMVFSGAWTLLTHKRWMKRELRAIALATAGASRFQIRHDEDA